jgi:hypothetical protein
VVYPGEHTKAKVIVTNMNGASVPNAEVTFFVVRGMGHVRGHEEGLREGTREETPDSKFFRWTKEYST